MYQRGEESPLDIYPILDDFELSILRTYIKVSRLRSNPEGLITAQDYLSALELFDLLENKNILLPILCHVDLEITPFQNNLSKKKEQINVDVNNQLNR